jgi:hypothetical protein
MGYRIATSPNDLVSVGNALRDGVRGWLGELAAPCSGLAHEQALDIKWGQHPKGGGGAQRQFGYNCSLPVLENRPHRN